MGFELDSRTQWGSISQIYNVLLAHVSIQFFVVFLMVRFFQFYFCRINAKKKIHFETFALCFLGLNMLLEGFLLSSLFIKLNMRLHLTTVQYAWSRSKHNFRETSQIYNSVLEGTQGPVSMATTTKKKSHTPTHTHTDTIMYILFTYALSHTDICTHTLSMNSSWKCKLKAKLI